MKRVLGWVLCLSCLVGRAWADEPKPPLGIEVPETVQALRDLAEPATVTLKERNVAAVSLGTPHGLTLDAAGELVQVLGEVVVDRATGEAFRIMSKRIRAMLDCGASSQPLTRTCQVLDSLRLQDVATAPNVLMDALLEDFTGQLATADYPASEEHQGSVTNVMGSFVRDMSPMLFRVGRLQDSQVSLVARSTLMAEAKKLLRSLAPARSASKGSMLAPGPAVIDVKRPGRELRREASSEKPCDSLPKADAALMLAGGAFLACGSTTEPDKCPTAAWIEATALSVCKWSPGDAKQPVVTAAQGLAQKLAMALSAGGKKPDNQARQTAAVEVVFDYLCLRLDFDAGCRAAEGDEVESAKRTVRLARTVALGLLDGEPLKVVVAIGDQVLLSVKDDEARARHRRAFRFLASLVDYTRTFVDRSGEISEDKADNSADLHAQRTQIIKSLAAEMTDRTGRGGDWIFSVGGSLRGVGGFRWNGDDTDFLGPVSLPLGFGLDRAFEGASHGVHFEAGVLDIGQYLSLEDGSVREPDLLDAFTVSLSVGFYWGSSLPAYLGVTGSYSPGLDLDQDGAISEGAEDEHHGALAVGLTAGIYVPIFDFN